MVVQPAAQPLTDRSSQAKMASATITAVRRVAGYNQQLVEAQTGCACLVPQTPGRPRSVYPGRAVVWSLWKCWRRLRCGFGRIVNGQWLAGGREDRLRAVGAMDNPGGPGGGGGGGDRIRR